MSCSTYGMEKKSRLLMSSHSEMGQTAQVHYHVMGMDDFALILRLYMISTPTVYMRMLLAII